LRANLTLSGYIRILCVELSASCVMKPSDVWQ